MYEFKKIITTYFNKDKLIDVYYEIDENELNKMIQNMRPYEKPDIISIYDDKIIGIEHFEFDSYKRTNKGSDLKRQDAFIRNSLNEEINKDLQDNESVIISDDIKSTASLENYYNNFKHNFINHYKKLDSYKEHILNDYDNTNKKIEFWFFVEDTTLLGNYFLNGKRKMRPLSPLYSKQICNLLNNSPRIKGIFLAQHFNSENIVTIIINTKENIKRFINESYIVTNDNYIYFEPQITGYAFKISQEELTEDKSV